MKQSSENAAEALQEIDQTVVAICRELPDPRMIRAVVERASGQPWDKLARIVGVDPRTVHRWREDYPIDDCAAQVAHYAMSEGVLLLKSGFTESARALVESVSGLRELNPVQLGAAKAIVGTALKVALAEVGIAGSAGGGPAKRSASSLPDGELRVAVRAVAKMRKGK